MNGPSRQENTPSYDVIVVGGGLGGLVAANLLSRKGNSVALFERKRYPFHRVCGEYVSNETVPFLRAHGLFPEQHKPESIEYLRLTSVLGKPATMKLDLGGFGVSRYAFDHFLYERAIANGVDVRFLEVDSVKFDQDHFEVATGANTFQARVVLAAHGKRSKLDYSMARSFISKRSPYVGVKYHIEYPHERGWIELHNFKDGYCGISNVEDGKTNLCYLVHRDQVRRFGDIRKMEEAVLFRNPFLRAIFERAKFVFEKPEVINEISFATKMPIEEHMMMVGDAAGMITPLCGNGMAMAIHGAKLASDVTSEFLSGRLSRGELEENYSLLWTRAFARRLWVGRQVQNLFGAELASNIAVGLVRNVRPIANFLLKQTHGKPF